MLQWQWEWFGISAADSLELNEKNTNKYTHTYAHPKLIRFSGDLQCAHKYEFRLANIPSDIVRRYTKYMPWYIVLNLRQVTPRLCRLCRQHCQIISLICSIRIGKVYIQPQASNSNIILKLFSVKFTVWLPLFSCLLTLLLSPKI